MHHGAIEQHDSPLRCALGVDRAPASLPLLLGRQPHHLGAENHEWQGDLDALTRSWHPAPSNGWAQEDVPSRLSFPLFLPHRLRGSSMPRGRRSSGSRCCCARSGCRRRRATPKDRRGSRGGVPPRFFLSRFHAHGTSAAVAILLVHTERQGKAIMANLGRLLEMLLATRMVGRGKFGSSGGAGRYGWGWPAWSRTKLRRPGFGSTAVLLKLVR